MKVYMTAWTQDKARMTPATLCLVYVTASRMLQRGRIPRRTSVHTVHTWVGD